MSRSRLRLAAVVVATGATVAIAGVAGADETTTIYVSDVGGNCFTATAGNPACGAKPTVTIQTGDTVKWDFTGGAVTHNVADGDSGNSPKWASPFDNSPYSRTYTTPGTYRFICQAHTLQNMEGTVIVEGAPVEPSVTATPTPTPTPTPTAIATPFPTTSGDDHTVTPAPGHAGIKDAAAPRLARASVKKTTGGARVRFWLSEPATVQITLRRAKTTVARATVQAPAGTRAAVLRAKLKRGTYTVELRAADAMGNRAPAATKTVKVK